MYKVIRTKIYTSTTEKVVTKYDTEFEDVEDAFYFMQELAFGEIRREIVNLGASVVAYATSNSKYPDAWGYANNGIQYRTDRAIVQFEVIEK